MLLLATAGVGIGLAVRTWQVDRQTRAAEEQALHARDRARQAAAEAQHQRDWAQKAEAEAKEQLEQSRSGEKATRRALQNTNAVLAFLQKNVLVGHGKDVRLRQAVDAAEPKVAKAFADRPLVEAAIREASVREILGTAYLALGETARAVQQYERALALREAILGPDHPDTGECRNQLAVAYRRAGRIAEASRLFEHNRLSRPHAAALSVQGSALLAEKKPFEAELKLRECLAIRRKIQPDDWTTFDAQAVLGATLLEQKKYAEAESMLLSGYAGMKQREAKIPLSQWGRLTKALQRLVRLYESWGKPEKAARWRKELETAAPPKKS